MAIELSCVVHDFQLHIIVDIYLVSYEIIFPLVPYSLLQST